MNNEKNKLFYLFNFIIFIFLIFFIDLNLSPDSKTFISEAKNLNSFSDLFHVGAKEYTMTYLIFKFVLSFNNFFLSYKIFNFFCFLGIVLTSLKILEFYKVNIRHNLVFSFFIIIYYSNYDLIQWIKYALTDLVLVFLMLLSIYMFLTKKYIFSIFIYFLSALIKPQSIFILFILSYLFVYKITKKNNLFFLLYAIFYILIISLTYFLIKSGFENQLLNILKIIFFSRIEEGAVVHHRIYIDYNEDLFSLIKIYFLRLVNIFSIYFDEFSIKHKIYKSFYFLILYLPIILFFVKGKFKNINKIVNFSLSSTMIIVTFIVLTFIDYDLRYRIYFLPFLMILSIYCFSNLIKKNISNGREIIKNQ